MKKFIFCIVFFILICIGTFYFVENKFDNNIDISKNYTCENIEEENFKEDVISPKECLNIKNKSYKIKEYEGNIAVFKNGNDSPLTVLSVCIDELPETDQNLLKDGIDAESEEELNELLEDYCS